MVYSVVVLPEPVGPVTSTIPLASAINCRIRLYMLRHPQRIQPAQIVVLLQTHHDGLAVLRWHGGTNERPTIHHAP